MWCSRSQHRQSDVGTIVPLSLSLLSRSARRLEYSHAQCNSVNPQIETRAQCPIFFLVYSDHLAMTVGRHGVTRDEHLPKEASIRA